MPSWRSPLRRLSSTRRPGTSAVAGSWCTASMTARCSHSIFARQPPSRRRATCTWTPPARWGTDPRWAPVPAACRVPWPDSGPCTSVSVSCPGVRSCCRPSRSRRHTCSTASVRSGLQATPGTFALFPSSAAIFLRTDGRPWRAGDTLYQADLARTLTQVADSGADVFYRGSVAETIAVQVQLGGGLIAREDLAQYQALWRTPLQTTYRGWRVITMPPVSGGGTTLIQALNILEGYELPGNGHGRAGAPGGRGAAPGLPRPQQPAGRSRLRATCRSRS